jgi:phosphoribosylaminoimidazolecarboxamide formyltransferase/IMP cyclohydrolase
VNIKAKRALISVFYKDGLDSLAQTLHQYGVEIISTGGTQTFIEALGIPVMAVESMTGFPSILGGRVKTLHPGVFGGILGRRENAGDKAEMAQHGIENIDIVVVDLYPFEETLKSGASEEEIIEKIDIGGISLIRAAAKNHKDVVILASKADYGHLVKELNANHGASTMAFRKRMAAKAFAVSSHYDSAIFNYFQGEDMMALRVSEAPANVLRYGENPHQKGVFFGDLDALFDKLHGKELSYNNLLDVDAAVNLMDEFSETTFAILKHNNACGVASRNTVKEAYLAALAGDPTSAFGGILITNRTIEADAAEEINQLFCEVIIAPAYSAQALDILKSKKNRIILQKKETTLPTHQLRTALNGLLWQQKDHSIEGKQFMTAVTQQSPSETELKDLEFALKICKHTKSNTIVLAKDKQLIASGTGQTSRVDALKQAIEKARAFQFDLNGAVMASDAFFPFADSVEIANYAGIKAVVQPGGSVRDQETIDFCNAHDMRMVFTGVRHFKH